MNELRQYVQTGSQDAFAALVGRYIDLVYASALRHVNDRELAQDITQAVFTLLVQKAATVSQERPLSAWLLATTRFISLNERRLRSNRRKLEQTVAAMSDQQRRGDSSTPDWQALGPVIDEGLARMRRSDRDLLMLRFFECKSLRDVAQKLGISEEAATKRVTRAVDRLRSFFLRRGITTADLAPAMAVLAGGAGAAPEALRQALIAIAVSQAATTGAAAGGTASAAQTILSALGTGAGTMSAAKITGLAAAAVIACTAVTVVIKAQSTPPQTARAAAPVNLAAPATQNAPPTTVPWANPTEQKLLLAARDECFPQPVCDYLLINRTLLSAKANLLNGRRPMTQATALDRNAKRWMGIVLAQIETPDHTLRLGNTDLTGPAAIISDSGTLFPIERTQRNPNGPGKWRATAKIDEPWEPNKAKQFCWLTGAGTIAASNGAYPVRLRNFPGVDCVQQLVLIMPKGWNLRSSSEPAASQQSVGDFVICFWQKEVQASDGYSVNVVLERTAKP